MMTRLFRFLATERALYVLVALFCILGVIYSVTTPIFEAGDELWHYPYVQYVATGNGLPVQDPTQKQIWEQEGGQPPLYYALAAAATFWINTGDLHDRLWRNPYAKIGIPLAFGNKNMVVHTPAEQFPWQGTTLAVHLIRLLSILFSAATVYFTYHLTRELFLPPSPGGRGAGGEGDAPSPPRSTLHAPLALFAASLVAFNPMFLFISASVNNDSLAALLATASIFLMVRLVTRGATNGRVLILGIVVALAILTKVSNLGLLGVGGLVLVYYIWLNRNRSNISRLTFNLLKLFALFIVPFLVLNVWWFARNFSLYGDPLAFNVWFQIAGGRAPTTLLGLLNEFQGFRISYWGNFGGVNVIAPEWVYTVLDLFSILAVVGLILGAIRRALPTLLWIPTLQLVVVFIALVRWTLLTYASQGRLMFPAIAAISILLVLGLYSLASAFSEVISRVVGRSTLHAPRSTPSGVGSTTPPLSTFFLPALLSLFLLALALLAPFLIVTPVYALPPRVAEESTIPNPVHIRYTANGASPELLGFETTRFVQPGQDLPLKLYWRTDSPVAQDLAMYIHVYDTRGKLIGQWDAYPGNGLYPPSQWQPGEIIADEYRVPVKPSGAYPPLGRIEVGMTPVGTSRVLTAQNPQGETITPSLAQFKFTPLSRPLAPTDLTLGNQFNLLNLGLLVRRGVDQITLEPEDDQKMHARPGDLLYVGANLQAIDMPDADYVYFVHLVAPNGEIIAQQDAQPHNNEYPTTFWNAHEQVPEVLPLDIPLNAAGDYTLEFGMYRASDLQRLPMSGQALGLWQVAPDHLYIPIHIGY